MSGFLEKPPGDRSGRINGGFFILETEVLHYIKNDQSAFEDEPLAKLANEKNLFAFEHEGFWRPMDTLRDKVALDDLWQKNRAPWKTW